MKWIQRIIIAIAFVGFFFAFAFYPRKPVEHKQSAGPVALYAIEWHYDGAIVYEIAALDNGVWLGYAAGEWWPLSGEPDAASEIGRIEL